jgi:uncharacterized membrane protein
MLWLRRSFIAGFFVMVPLFISVAATIWLFNVVDGATTPLYDRLLGRRIPGLGIASTAAVIILVGAFARNVIGRRILQRTERGSARAGVQQDLLAGAAAVAAFNPDSESGFKRV